MNLNKRVSVAGLALIIMVITVHLAGAAEKQLEILGDRTDALVLKVTSSVETGKSGAPNVYHYAIDSSTASLKPVALFALGLGKTLPPLTEIHSPHGWSFFHCSQDPVKACWSWNGEKVGKLPPGKRLEGFSFSTPLPVGTVNYFIANNPDNGEIDMKDDFSDGFVSGQTNGPRSN